MQLLLEAVADGDCAQLGLDHHHHVLLPRWRKYGSPTQLCTEQGYFQLDSHPEQKYFQWFFWKKKYVNVNSFLWIVYNFEYDIIFWGEYQRFKMEYLPLKREDNSLYICVFSQSVFPKSVSISVFLKIVFFSPKVYLPKKYFPKCIFQKPIFWKWYFPKIYFPKFIFWTCVYESVFSKGLFPRRPW